MTDRGSAYFDRWYADMTTAPVKDGILRRHLGLPVELGPTGILAAEALDEIETALGPLENALLADIACGRGAYGIEIAHRTGAALIGVDFSAVALVEARRTAERRLAPGRAEFRTGTLTDTGLAGNSADALMCTDSIQFADTPAGALREFRRVLRPGGRLALTTWQPTQPGDPRVGPRLRHLDLESELREAGFGDVEVGIRPRWHARERAAFEEAVGMEDDGSDPALSSFRNEGRRSLENFDTLQRIAAFATAP